ncbi:MAG: hypothetical protein ACR2PX_28930 [Endozoicomonas sp.]|uniref:hypothetical protein n=1 Tax=Endozoicomonas sp. TaxID=1892382 RepID=UPI003D9BC28F
MSFRQLLSGICFSFVLSFHSIVQAQPSFLLRVHPSLTPGLPPTILLYTPDGELLQWTLQLDWMKDLKRLPTVPSKDVSLKQDDNNLLRYDPDTEPLNSQQVQALMNYLESGFAPLQGYQNKTTLPFMVEHLNNRLVDLDQLQQHYTLTLTDVAPTGKGFTQVVVTDNHGNTFEYRLRDQSVSLHRSEKRNAKATAAQKYLNLLENECDDETGITCLNELLDDPPDYVVHQQRLVRSINHVTDEYGNFTNTTIAPETDKGPVISNTTAIYIISTIGFVYIVIDIVLATALCWVCWVCWGIKTSKDAVRSKPQGKDPKQPKVKFQGSPLEEVGGGDTRQTENIMLQTTIDISPVVNTDLLKTDSQLNKALDRIDEEEETEFSAGVEPPKLDGAIKLEPATQ